MGTPTVGLAVVRDRPVVRVGCDRGGGLRAAAWPRLPEGRVWLSSDRRAPADAVRIFRRSGSAVADGGQALHRRNLPCGRGDRSHRTAQELGDERHDHGRDSRADKRPLTPDPGGRERRRGGREAGDDQRFQRDAAAASVVLAVCVGDERLHNLSLVRRTLEGRGHPTTDCQRSDGFKICPPSSPRTPSWPTPGLGSCSMSSSSVSRPPTTASRTRAMLCSRSASLAKSPAR
jgi:hypothetical protein